MEMFSYLDHIDYTLRIYWYIKNCNEDIWYSHQESLNVVTVLHVQIAALPLT